ncbi:MAG: hypothetical protein PUB00_05845, partial [Clostridiales bacterium]|nr:hypothetical protein [Clostridiales bacterium]
MGIHREDYDEASLTGLSRDALNLLKSYGRRDWAIRPELIDSLPRYGSLVNYLLTDDLILKKFISHMTEYEEILVKLEETVNSNEESINAVRMISELHKKRIIRSIQPDTLQFIHGFGFDIMRGNCFSYFDTAPITIPVDEVNPKEAFRIGLNLAIYHWQHPDRESYGARVFLENPYEQLPSISIQGFCQAFNRCIEEHFPDDEQVSYATVHGWLSGEFIPKAKYLRILCAFFSCDIDYLFGGQCFPLREFDELCYDTGLTNVFFYFFRNQPEPVRNKIEYLITRDAFYSTVTHMKNCILVTQIDPFRELVFCGAEDELELQQNLYDDLLAE